MESFQVIKNRGLLQTIETIFNRIVPAWVFRFSVGSVFELDLQKLQAAAPSTSLDFTLTNLEPEAADREKLRTATWNCVPLKSSANDFGYAITENSAPKRMVGGVWGGIASFHEANLGFQLQLDEKQAWIYCAYLRKESRGLGLYKPLLSFATRDLTNRGYTRALVMIQPWNKASLAAHRLYFQRESGKIMVIRIFSLCSVFVFGNIKKECTFTFRPFTCPVQVRIE